MIFLKNNYLIWEKTKFQKFLKNLKAFICIFIFYIYREHKGRFYFIAHFVFVSFYLI